MVQNWLKFKKTGDTVTKNHRSWVGKLVGLFKTDLEEEELWDNLEELLISGDMGIGTTETLLMKVKDRLKKAGPYVTATAINILKEEMLMLIKSNQHSNNIFSSSERPQIILVIGVNGVGKTTSIAKMAKAFLSLDKQPLLVAGDTFRAAAIEQLQAWGKKLNIDVVAHNFGGDPSAVVYDGMQATIARKIPVTIVDTAGRLHTNLNLMEELKKTQRTIKKFENYIDQKIILVLDGTSGQNGLFQATRFKEAVGCDGIFLTKMDGSAKGGIIFSISHELELPVLFVGTGENEEDIVHFNPEEFIETLFQVDISK